MPRRTSDMPKRIITELSVEQESILVSYQEKWKTIATLTEPSDREKVTESIRAAYAVSNYPTPEIVFSCNPFAALEEILATENFNTYLGCNIYHKFSERVIRHLHHLIKRQFDQTLFYKLNNKIEYPEFPNHLDRYNNPKAFHFPRGIKDCIKAQVIKDFDKAQTEYSELAYCYVAFFGTSFPNRETECKPYILRYAAISLEILE